MKPMLPNKPRGNSGSRRSFDGFADAQQDRCWDLDFQCLGRFEIYYQLELGRLLDWKIGGISPRKIRSA